jgi:hypothetical protein
MITIMTTCTRDLVVAMITATIMTMPTAMILPRTTGQRRSDHLKLVLRRTTLQVAVCDA